MKISFVFALVFAAAVAGLSVDVKAAIFSVNTTADTQDAAPGNGICADSGGMCSLRAAITEANALAGADTINLPAGTFTETLAAANEDLNSGGDFDITSPIAISGAGAGSTIVQANASLQTANERVFHILAGGTSVTISGMTIQNGVNRFANATGGGGIRVEGSTANLTLHDATVTGNYSEGRGGGISTNKANLTITNCIFNNNQAGSSVAGSNSSGGAIAVDSEDNIAVAGQTASITNTIVNLNRSESSVANTFGGGISVRALNATVTVSGSTISNNTSNALGGFNGFAGGIHNQQAHLILTNSTVFGNTSSRYHAGVRNLSSTAAASTFDVINSTIRNNTSSIDDALGGGGANVSSTTFTATMNITGSTISGNTLPGSTSIGGGLVNAGSSTGAALMNLLNSTVSGNSAHDGGGIYTDGSAATTVVDYSTIAANSAVGEGGGLYQDVTAGGTTTIKDSIVADNTAPNAPDIDGTINSQNYNHVENTSGGVFLSAANDVTGSDPQLGPLQNNGGPTLTHDPSFASPVIDTIPNGTNGCGTTVTLDQRGLVRPTIILTNKCDKGSAEKHTEEGTPTASNTNTPTATNTPTGSATNTATPTPTETATVTGVVTYGNAVSGPTPPRFVANAILTASGIPSSSTITNPFGVYSLQGFISDTFTITASKGGNINGITSFDAARIAQHAAGVVLLTGNQLVVADVSGNGTISSFDSAEVAGFVVGTGQMGATGTWRFIPPSRSYVMAGGIIPNQNYEALLMGEVSGNWVNDGGPRGVGSGSREFGRVAENNVSVNAPNSVAVTGRDVVIPVRVKGVANKGIISYQFDLRYDPKVILPRKNVVDLIGTVSNGFVSVVNTSEAGLLRVAVFGIAPLTSDGVLLRLRFNAVEDMGSEASLVWEQMMVNEDEVVTRALTGERF